MDSGAPPPPDVARRGEKLPEMDYCRGDTPGSRAEQGRLFHICCLLYYPRVLLFSSPWFKVLSRGRVEGYKRH